MAKSTLPLNIQEAISLISAIIRRISEKQLDKGQTGSFLKSGVATSADAG
ncbi:MAG: hypothetical protein IJS15_00130 [Victivallales bacterium]|nr:hypothetical protein [Victivallales bacterium]